MEKYTNELSSETYVEPPKWHGEELARRKKAVTEGKVAYTYWDKAKEEIRKKFSKG